MSYAVTATSSVEAPQFRVRPSSVTAEQFGMPGRVGAWVSAAASTVSLSRLGPPTGVVAVARILLPPAARSALIVFVAQVVQFAVGGKDTFGATTLPPIEMSMGRSAPVPLA